MINPDPVQAFNRISLESIVEGDQGQGYVPVYWGGPDGNVPDSDTCAVRILMTPGKVSTPHIHDEVQVTVSLETAWYGVLTLWGPDLEHATWLYPSGILTIRPGQPHVALYPRHRPDNNERIHVEAIATEVRNTPDYRHDIRPMPQLWTVARRRTNQMGLEHLFNWPTPNDG